ncbi:MAG: CPBP family intramembrane glutamic endopeptidase [Gemmatales bacterium]|nr:CPBP family intramembrane metalloprotease [Gemmatales bacterium]MDW7995844.1 CPBP family intramembrane glutamic endopeptidase [Gemmatales bacterium]
MLFFPTVAALFYFLILSGSAWAKPIYIVAKTIQFGFPVLYVHLVQRQTLSVRAPHRKDWLVGFASGIALVMIIWVAYFAYYRSQPWMTQVGAHIWGKLQEIGATTLSAYLGLALLLSIVHALLEEYYWRWFVWSELSQRWPSWLAIIMANAAFTLHHIVVLYVYIPGTYFWTSGMLFSLGIMVGGMIWSLVYRYTGNIYSAWVSHVLVDGALMYIGYDLTRSYWP